MEGTAVAEVKDCYARLARATQIFTPARPIDSLALLSGRMEQVMDILSAIGQDGQHVALYGERGVGKTSIASILAEAVAKRPNVTRPVSVRIGCTTNDDFKSVWGQVFRELGIPLEEDRCGPAEIRQGLSKLEDQTFIVLDEFDRLVDDEAISLLSDTIKTLSDRPVKATVLLVGVADSIDQLVGDHKSVQRALKQVHIPRMSAHELEGIVEKGGKHVPIVIDAELRRMIAELSEGLPHYTHALGLYAVQRAIEDDQDALSRQDVERSIELVVKKSQQTTLTAYNKATRSAHSDALFARVLLACALAKKDELGFFPAREVARPLSLITGHEYDIPAFAKHLKKFSKGNAILQKHGEERRYFYRFEDPMMQPFVILKGLSSGLITEEKLAEIKASA